MDTYVTSRGALSKHIGVATSTISRWLECGAPPKTRSGYSVEAWKKWHDEHVNSRLPADEPSVERRTNGSDGEYNPPEYADGLRVKKLYEETRIRELQRQKEEGQLVNKDRMIQLMQRHIIHARVIQETIPESISMLIGDSELRQLVKSESARILADSHRALEQSVVDMDESE